MDKKNFTILLVSTVLAAFLGAFWAVYLSRPPHPPLGMNPPMPIAEQEKMMEQQEDYFEKFNHDFDELVEHSPARGSFISINNAGLKTEETKDMYKIIVDLKPFNNDEKNVNVKTHGKTVSISAQYKSKDKNEYSSSQFHQELMLPTKIDANAVKEEKKGDSLIITIPKIEN